jgi:hypothetical protein
MPLIGLTPDVCVCFKAPHLGHEVATNRGQALLKLPLIAEVACAANDVHHKACVGAGHVVTPGEAAFLKAIVQDPLKVRPAAYLYCHMSCTLLTLACWGVGH